MSGNAAPENIVRRFLDEVLGAGKLDVLDEIIAPGLLNDARDGMLAMRAAFPDATVRVNRLIVAGSEVAAHVTITATHLGDWRGLTATKRRVTYDSTLFATVRDGLIAETSGVSDIACIWEQLRPRKGALAFHWLSWIVLLGVASGAALLGTGGPFSR